jgi:3-oxoadipate enol-lactonase
MQSAIYAGVPAANTGFTHALAILREVEQIGYVLAAAPGAAAAHPASAARAAPPAARPALQRARTAQRQGAAPYGGAEPRARLRPDMWDGLANQLARLPRDRLRPPRPWQLGRAGGPVHDGRPGRRCRAPAARTRYGAGGVGRPVDGRHGRPGAGAAPSRAGAGAGAGEYHQRLSGRRARGVAAAHRHRAAQGIEAIADAVMGRYFHDGFRADKAGTVARFRRRLVTTDADRLRRLLQCGRQGRHDRAPGADRRCRRW